VLQAHTKLDSSPSVEKKNNEGVGRGVMGSNTSEEIQYIGSILEMHCTSKKAF